MGYFSDMLGTLKSTFKVGNTTFDTSNVDAAKTLLVPNVSGTLATLADIAVGSSQNVFIQATDPLSANPYVWYKTDPTSGAVIDILKG